MIAGVVVNHDDLKQILGQARGGFQPSCPNSCT
jgi:hypothetical protein